MFVKMKTFVKVRFIPKSTNNFGSVPFRSPHFIHFLLSSIGILENVASVIYHKQLLYTSFHHLQKLFNKITHS